ncbi:MAG: N-acetyl-gamma-glutamyl-phosphate reductase, partial [Clostridiales bacterium]|nr:N-acetyl-gamma-glutamyl-phosphate reductase [Clostridiales bacterium]
MRVYIDGSAGATGLELESRLRRIDNVTLIKPDEELRKDTATRKKFLNEADAVFLCLPDAAAREAAAMVENPNTVVIDASTAHRTAEGWAYGFPELSEEHENAVRASNRIAVPGCHASGFVALVYPAVRAGLIYPDDVLFCHSLTGYSGGGKALIAEYEAEGAEPSAAKLYALGLHHKHLPEMQRVCGLTYPPVFTPVLVNTHRGMVVTVPVIAPAPAVWEYFAEYYQGAAHVKVMPFAEY